MIVLPSGSTISVFGLVPRESLIQYHFNGAAADRPQRSVINWEREATVNCLSERRNQCLLVIEPPLLMADVMLAPGNWLLYDFKTWTCSLAKYSPKLQSLSTSSESVACSMTTDSSTGTSMIAVSFETDAVSVGIIGLRENETRLLF